MDLSLTLLTYTSSMLGGAPSRDRRAASNGCEPLGWTSEHDEIWLGRDLGPVIAGLAAALLFAQNSLLQITL